MRSDRLLNRTDERGYRNQVMIAMIATLVFAILLFRYLPVYFDSDRVYQDIREYEDVIAFEDITVVQERAAVPPPPSPRHPEPRPDDEIIEDDEFDFEDAIEEVDLELPEPEMGDNGESSIAENPARPPNVRKIVEPSVSRERSRNREQVRIYVTFLVNEEGKVEEVELDELQIFDEDENAYVTVESIDPFLIEATLKAAYRWEFRPAEDGGREVRARTRHVFTYGN